MTTRAAQVHDLLTERGATVATAESLTGGQLAAELTATPGASETFIGGVVSYATEVKLDVLGVDADLVERYGVVSAECAAEMARGVRALMKSTYALSTTGVAGPAEQEGKEPGTVFVGVAGPDGVTAIALDLDGERSEITKLTVTAALGALEDALRQEETALG